MENLHDKQSKVSERQALMAMTSGNPIGFYEHNIKREQGETDKLIERIINEACPAGMAKTLEM